MKGERCEAACFPPAVGADDPFAYVPQALGFTLARVLGLNKYCPLYLGRFSTLCCLL